MATPLKMQISNIREKGNRTLKVENFELKLEKKYFELFTGNERYKI